MPSTTHGLPYPPATDPVAAGAAAIQALAKDGRAARSPVAGNLRHHAGRRDRSAGDRLHRRQERHRRLLAIILRAAALRRRHPDRRLRQQRRRRLLDSAWAARRLARRAAGAHAGFRRLAPHERQHQRGRRSFFSSTRSRDGRQLEMLAVLLDAVRTLGRSPSSPRSASRSVRASSSAAATVVDARTRLETLDERRRRDRARPRASLEALE